MNPNSKSTVYEFARTLNLADKCDEALEFATRKNRDRTSSIELWHEKAVAQWAIGKYEAAIQSLMDLLEQEPQHAMSWQKLRSRQADLLSQPTKN